MHSGGCQRWLLAGPAFTVVCEHLGFVPFTRLASGPNVPCPALLTSTMSYRVIHLPSLVSGLQAPSTTAEMSSSWTFPFRYFVVCWFKRRVGRRTLRSHARWPISIAMLYVWQEYCCGVVMLARTSDAALKAGDENNRCCAAG